MQLEIDRTVLVLIDVQEKLAAAMHNHDALLSALHKIVAGAKALDIPVIWNEQNPLRMGPTISPLRDLLLPAKPIAKMSFGCCGSKTFMSALQATGRDQVLIAGIEAHVCVYQTAVQLPAYDYEVQVVTDAVSSRNPFDRDIAIKRITYALATQSLSPITTAEAALFELMQTAEHPRFKEILKIIR